MMKLLVICLSCFVQNVAVWAQSCGSTSADFIVQKGDALLAAIEDDVRADLAKVGINLNTRFLEKEDFNSNMTSGNFHFCFSETWGPPYDPHSYASSWKSPDEAHFAALKGMKDPTQAKLTTDISNVLLEENLQTRQQKWKGILTALHGQAIDLPFSGKRIPTVLGKRLAGFVAGQQQFDYPVHTLQVLSGSKTITVAPGAQSGLFSTVGRLDPHTYRPNEFFANNWVYEGLVAYGADGIIEPALASSWVVTDKAGGGQEYKFTLRQGVTFHDGSAWNCAVAKLNFDHVLAQPLRTGDYHGWYDLPKQVHSWSCAGTYEFVVTTKNKYYPFLQELSYIRPLRMLSGAMFANGLTTDPKTHNSCHKGWGTITGNGETITCAGIKGVAGTGPLKYIDTKSNGDAQFDRHAAHWRAMPQVETIIVKKYKDHLAVMAALLGGTLDAVVGAGVLQPADLKTLQTTYAADFHVFLGPPIQNRIIIMNANKAPTDDLTFRKVVMHSVNKAAIIDKELYGFAEPIDTLFPKNAPYSDVDLLPRWDYDIEKARLLRCPVTTSSTSSTSSTKDGIDVGIVIAIIVGILVLAFLFGFALFMYGRKQGALYEKLVQSQGKVNALDQAKQRAQQDGSDTLGKPTDNLASVDV
jgi:ABC-type transport system substrate-binding protein